MLQFVFKINNFIGNSQTVVINISCVFIDTDLTSNNYLYLDYNSKHFV